MGNREQSAEARHCYDGLVLGNRWQRTCAGFAVRIGRSLGAVLFAVASVLGLSTISDARADAPITWYTYNYITTKWWTTPKAGCEQPPGVWAYKLNADGLSCDKYVAADNRYYSTQPAGTKIACWDESYPNTWKPLDQQCSAAPPPPPACPSNGQTASAHLACIKQLTYERASCPVGNPIYPGRGNKAQSEIRYAAATATDLSLIDTYRSDWASSPQAGLGSRWTHNWARALDIAAASNAEPVVVAIRADGSPIPFYKDTTTGAWTVAQNISVDRLDAIPTGEPSGARWRYTDTASDAQEQYDDQGRLLSVRERNGWTTTLSYSTAATPANLAPRAGLLLQVQNQFGRVLNFTYDASGRVATVSGSIGPIATYSYNALSLPDRVTWADGKSRQYHYEDSAVPGGLTGITDEAGVRFATYAYDNQGRATSSEHAGGVGKVLLQFLAGNQTTVTTADGSSRTITFQSQGNVIHPTSVSAPCPECGNAAKTTAYEGSGNVSSRVGFDNKETRYTYDTRGRETQRIEGYGTAEAKTTTTEWHPTWNLPVRVAEPGRLEYISYDTNGQIIGYAWYATNDPNGSLGTNVTPAGPVRSTGWAYDANGNRSATTVLVDASVVGQWTYTYDAKGQLQTITDSAGRIARATQYDAAGRLIEGISLDGEQLRYQYNARGDLTTYEVNGRVLTYEYDPNGFLTAIRGPNDYYTGYLYDAAHRLTGILETPLPAGVADTSSPFRMLAASGQTPPTPSEAVGAQWRSAWVRIVQWLTSWISRAHAQVVVPVLRTIPVWPSRNQTSSQAQSAEDELMGMTENPNSVLSTIGRSLRELATRVTEPMSCDEDSRCTTARRDAQAAHHELTTKRWGQYVSGGTKGSDAGHRQSVIEAQNRLRKAIRRVKLYCVAWPLELPEWEYQANRDVPILY